VATKAWVGGGRITTDSDWAAGARHGTGRSGVFTARNSAGSWRGGRKFEVVSRLHRITSDPEVCHGKPVIRGLRYPVADILQLLAGGMSVDEVLADYPDLERDDVLAALEYGALAVGNRRIPLAG
jgi:uncharacterized protein (DUF433 family)